MLVEYPVFTLHATRPAGVYCRSMSRRTLWYVVSGLAAGLVLGVAWGLFSPKTSEAPTVNTANSNTAAGTNTSNTNSAATTAHFSTVDLPDRDSAFAFAADIPSAWAVEYVSGSQAINVYDPKGAGSTSLANSKIFMKYFRASTFETLTTVDILSQQATTINGRPAVVYTIKKKVSVADFAAQPSWRNGEHQVTDIRTTDAGQTIFYVVAKAPDVGDAVFTAFLASLKFTATDQSIDVVYPLHDFLARITKKHFGQYITPQNSPVSPERFSGYHTGVDAEAKPNEASTDVPVYAIAPGTVVMSRRVSGYGGVVMIAHRVDNQTVTALYGHLDSTTVTVQVGDTVAVGQRFAALGAGGTTETDGERQHLHFGLLSGSSTNIKGYVSTKAGLAPWVDPVAWLADHGAIEVTTP